MSDDWDSDYWDTTEEAEREWQRKLETGCIHCGAPESDNCNQCGIELCAMHYEIGAGFCKEHPDDEYEG